MLYMIRSFDIIGRIHGLLDSAYGSLLLKLSLGCAAGWRRSQLLGTPLPSLDQRRGGLPFDTNVIAFFGQGSGCSWFHYMLCNLGPGLISSLQGISGKFVAFVFFAGS